MRFPLLALLLSGCALPTATPPSSSPQAPAEPSAAASHFPQSTNAVFAWTPGTNWGTSIVVDHYTLYVKAGAAPQTTLMVPPSSSMAAVTLPTDQTSIISATLTRKVLAYNVASRTETTNYSESRATRLVLTPASWGRKGGPARLPSVNSAQ